MTKPLDSSRPPPRTEGKLRKALSWLAARQVQQPFTMLAVATITLAIAGFLASGLKLKTSFGELLPENKTSVKVAAAVNAKLPAQSTVTLLISGSDTEGLKRLVDTLGPRLRGIGLPWVGAVDTGVHASRRFFKERQFLYAPRALVQEVHDEVQQRYDYEVGKEAGFLLDDDDDDDGDDDDAPPAPLTRASLEAKLKQRADKAGLAAAEKRYPDGYYLDPEAHQIVVLVRTPLAPGDVAKTEILLRKLQTVYDSVKPEAFDAQAKLSMGGNLITSAETYQQITGDLAHVGAWGIGLILAVVLLYFLRIRTLLAMMLVVGVGAVWTFGLARLTIGHLNSSTGFLFSIVVGNGINFGILYMARYLEVRKHQNLADAIQTATEDTYRSTLTAALAAAAAYGSLTVTDFRGFKHFGLIGASGMILCWLATYLFLPPVLVAMEKVAPFGSGPDRLDPFRSSFGKPFAWLIERAPRLVVGIGIIISVGSAGLGYRYVTSDPMEYDMRQIDNAPVKIESEARRVARVADPLVGRQGQDGLAIMVDRVDQAEELRVALEAVKAKAEKKPFESVVTIYSLLPKEQQAKLELAKATRRLLVRARKRGFVKDADWQELNELLPEKHLKTITIADLPDKVAAAFTESDGTRGRLVYIVPASGRSVWDGKYLIEWANSFRETTLRDGSVIHGSGRSVIFADMIQTIVDDAPKAIIASLLMTLVVVLLAHRRKRDALWVLGSVALGLTWTLGFLAIARTEFGGATIEWRSLKLNFLNFVAIPITIGVGADYAVNLLHRYRHVGGDLAESVRTTGGAVILCSLTTTLGYLALVLSVNRAIQSFGMAAAAGEIACVLCGVLILPAYLALRAKRSTNS